MTERLPLPDLPCARVIVVDDDPDIVSTLVARLEKFVQSS